MCRKRIRLLLALVLSTFVLNGCGTPLYEMTAEEEDLVIQYAAYYLAKNNTYQADGLVNISDALLNGEEEETAAQEETPTDVTESESSITPASGTTLGEVITLSQAIGWSTGLSVNCKEYYQSDSYKEGTYYSVTPSTGDSFVVMKFVVENITDETIDLDILSEAPRFRICTDGSSWVEEADTLLVYDLSTYMGSLEPGESKEMVLLFETSLPDGTVPLLSVVKGDVTHQVIY
jgi:hypothetical protein